MHAKFCVRTHGRASLLRLLPLIAALLVGPVYAKDLFEDLVAPLEPTDSKACAALRKQFEAEIDRLVKAHSECLTRNLNNRQSANTVPADREHELDRCSTPACQPEHTQSGKARKRQQEQDKLCEQRLKAYEERKRKAEEEERKRKQAEDALRRKKAEEERLRQEEEQREKNRKAQEELIRKAKAEQEKKALEDRQSLERKKAADQLKEQQTRERSQQQQSTNQERDKAAQQRQQAAQEQAKKIADEIARQERVAAQRREQQKQDTENAKKRWAEEERQDNDRIEAAKRRDATEGPYDPCADIRAHRRSSSDRIAYICLSDSQYYERGAKMNASSNERRRAKESSELAEREKVIATQENQERGGIAKLRQMLTEIKSMSGLVTSENPFQTSLTHAARQANQTGINAGLDRVMPSGPGVKDPDYERAAALANRVQSQVLKSNPFAQEVEGAALRSIEHVHRKDLGQVEQVNRGMNQLANEVDVSGENPFNQPAPVVNRSTQDNPFGSSPSRSTTQKLRPVSETAANAPECKNDRPGVRKPPSCTQTSPPSTIH